MIEALVSFVVEELGAIVKDEVGLLADVKKEIKSLSSTFLTIQALLADAERKQVTTDGLRVWLGKINQVAYEVEDILDEWRTNAFMSQHDEDEDDSGKIQKVRSCSLFPCLCFKQVKLRHDIGHRIREVRERLNEISEEKSKFTLKEVKEREVMSGPNKEERETGSFIDETKIFGRDEVKERIINQLVSETSREEKSVSIVSIVGMGGLGKTTLAQLIYNDERVMAHFEKRIWVCVSDPFDVKRIAIKVIESMGGSMPKNPDLDTLLHSLCEAIDKKRFLLVLDDVWDESGRLWQILRVPLLGAALGSKIVVTTRSGQVGNAMEAHHILDLGVLSDSDGWKLFQSIAFKGAEEEDCQELTEIGEKIIERCKGVPLAIQALGSLLRANRKKWYWEHVLESEIWKWDIPKDNGILPALLLSYYNLPPHLKRCFSFCSVFPKDHEIEKDELVKQWMAHGIIKSEKAKKDVTEEIGEMYFDYLLTRSLFQDAEKDSNGNVVRCKMHDLVHDLATFVGSGDYCSMEAGDLESCSIKCHHLSLLVNDDVSSIPSLLCKVERLHTLLLFEGASGIMAVPDSLFNPLRYLRALDLSATSIENLPSVTGTLRHLRYLNLCGLTIVELPESMTDLCNLQTLKLNYCKRLSLLPSGISKMVKLRHLEIERTTNLTVLPNGLGRLTSLRTLCKLPLGDENGGCKIGELKDLNLLTGELCIENLERVMNVNDASEAELHKKSDLHVLSLCCNDKSNEEWTTLGDDEMKRMDRVLEGLTPPHSNLKVLKIENYAGSMFPSWLDSRFSSLVEVVLENCRRLSSLPEGLGQLKALQTLNIHHCERLSSLPEGLGQLKALQTLRVYHCESLSSLPEGLGQLKALQTLNIGNCELLSSLPEGLRQLKALQTLRIRNCERLSSLPEGLGQLKALQTLQIHGCERLSSLPEGLGQLKALQTLEIWNYKRLSSLPEGLGQLKALQTLGVYHCESLSSLPEGLGQLKALQTLCIHNCERLSSLPEGLGQLKALQTLHIEHCDRLSSLPEGLRQLKALQTLQIWDCERLSSLFDGFEQLKSLCRLDIWDCPQLRPLPNLQRLDALQRLSIQRCPLLKDRLEKEKGEDWCKISHIPCIYIDDELDDGERQNTDRDYKRYNLRYKLRTLCRSSV